MTDGIRVLFDGYWWKAGPFSNRMVQREIIRTWRTEFPQDEIAIVVPRSGVVSDAPEGVEVIYSRFGGLQALLNFVALPIIARAKKSDVMIAHNFTPLTGRSVTFIHDLMFMDHPEWFTATENGYFRLMTLSARRRGSNLLTSSTTEAGRIARLTGRATEPIGLGLSPTLVHATPKRPSLPDQVRGFGLAVGRLNARKNLEMAVAGAVRSGRFSSEFPLVIVGAASGREVSWSSEATAAIEDGSAILLGSISDEELRWLYEGAGVFLMMSRDEGYGLPIAEANAFGTPTVASDIPVFRELFGDHAFLAHPDSRDEIAACIGEALGAPRPAPLILNDWQRTVSRLRHASLSAMRPRHEKRSPRKRRSERAPS